MDDFNKNMVKWVSYDNEIKKYLEKVKKLRSEKNGFLGSRDRKWFRFKTMG